MITHISCSIIIYDNNNRVLISKRSKDKKHFPLMWETIGGELEDYETPDECIKREVMKEINCNIINLKLFKVYVVNENQNREVLIVYTGRILEQIKCNKEIDQVKWIDKSEIENFNFCENELEKILDYYELNHNDCY